MKKKYLAFNTREEAESWVSSIDQNLGYPKPLINTRTYTEIIDHPADERVICIVCPECDDFLTEDQINSLLTREMAAQQGWFPVPEDML